jgi:hypothetical protein
MECGESFDLLRLRRHAVHGTDAWRAADRPIRTRAPSWLTASVKKLADYGTDDHPADDPERAQISWIVAAMDDCDECADLRVELTVEEVGRNGAGLVGHLSPDSARRLRAALATALREMGEAVE